MPSQVLRLGGEPPRRTQPTVVVLADDPQAVQALHQLLRHASHVICAATPKAALDAVAEHDVDVVLSDEQMPLMGGVELLANVRRLDPSVMGLLISGYTDIDALAAAINEAGVVGLLRRPWRDEDVLAAVRRAADASSLARLRSSEHDELRHHQEAVRVLVGHSPVGAALLGRQPDLVVLQLNRPFVGLFAETAGPVEGAPLPQFLTSETAAAIQELCRQALETDEAVTLPKLQWAPLDMGVRHVTCTVSALRETGGAVAFVIRILDITPTVEALEETRELAAQQAAVFEQMPNGVVVVDAQGRTVVRNDMARSLETSAPDPSYPTSAEGPRDARSGRLLDPEELPLRRALNGETTHLDYRHRRSDGDKEAWIRATAAPLRDDLGSITGAVGVFTDISADHNALVARTGSLASQGHEFRTPLTSIMGFAELLLDQITGTLTGRQIDAVRRIKSSARRLSRLIDTSLDLANLEAGQFNLHPTAVDVRIVISRVVAVFAPLARTKQQNLNLYLPPEPLIAWVDEDRLEQIVTTLVSNAHHYTLTGGHIVVAAFAQPGGTRVTFVDTGVGMTSGELNHLFMKYYRARNTATWDVPGSGLGLAIARSLIEKQGGSMTVESVAGEGSEFGFLLPPHELRKAAESLAQDQLELTQTSSS